MLPTLFFQPSAEEGIFLMEALLNFETQVCHQSVSLFNRILVSFYKYYRTFFQVHGQCIQRETQLKSFAGDGICIESKGH